VLVKLCSNQPRRTARRNQLCSELDPSAQDTDNIPRMQRGQ